ncbi:MAG: hypothetical protein FD167_3731 [bacterium]|nr:MAG: hypothetical protein FD167_3731 [bacterium]
MSAVNIRDLKANLSSHLNKVKSGQEVVILDRNRPIAKIVPFDPIDEPEAEELELVAAGLLRLPTQTLPDDFWDEVESRGISAEILIQAIKSDRDEK